jgi:hypothetical protein
MRGLFVGSAIGSTIIGWLLFQFFAEPCPVIAGVALQCVDGWIYLGDWMQGAGVVGAVIGFILGLISEVLPENNAR